MGIKIYTYSNPYEIDRESYWNEIKDCPHFCVSQTMVNGLEETYGSLRTGGYLTTIRILLNKLYSDWEDYNTRVRQIMEVDAVLNSITIDDDENGNTRKSLEYNTKSLVKCIRLFKELGLNAESFDVSRLTNDQLCLVAIYKRISARETSSFVFNRVDDEATINVRVMQALLHKHKNYAYDNMNKDAIVIHGIHQFSPAMLCAIEDISRFKNVILLFNYQEQYREIYQTWLNIYSLFDKKIIGSSEFEFKPISLFADCYAGNTLADSIGNVTNGQLSIDTNTLNNLEVIEFENITEFAGYCAVLFENAKKKYIADKKKRPVLTYMKDQMYSASPRVNDILRAYFPEQFGERHFLDYPFGHFFVAIMDMWDYEKEIVKVDELSSIKDCLSSGIISESRSGVLLNTFNTIAPYIEKQSTLCGIIKEIKSLRKYVSPVAEELQRIGYLNISKDEINELKEALEELDKIIKGFFKDFNSGGDNFNRFYARIHDFIVKKTQDMNSFDEEMKDVISKLLDRMNNIDLPETGTFTCLKQTMSFYLSQDDMAGRGASWIVRDFEQIDGDILRSQKQKSEDTCYHFCCLSDKDLCAVKDERLPWPLDIRFFEYSYEPLEQKYQIFLKSKMEFKNFKRYALLYGLEFNRIGCKLSYVKTENGKDNEIYHLIKLLGIKVKKYRNGSGSDYVPYFKYDNENANTVPEYSDIDKLKYAMCPYRFALESVVQENTLFRERFLVIFYLRILLENTIVVEYSGRKLLDNELRQLIEEEYDKLNSKFHISNEYEKTQIVSGVYSSLKYDLKKHNGHLKSINTTYKMLLNRKKDFLVIDLKSYESKVNTIDYSDLFRDEQRFETVYCMDCKYCSSKDICLKSLM